MQSLHFGQTFPAGLVLDPNAFGLPPGHGHMEHPSFPPRHDVAKPIVCTPPPVTVKYSPPPPVHGLGSSAPPVRKRKRTGREENDEISFVAIDRDILLQMSLQELESVYISLKLSYGLSDHIQQRAVIRSFTEAEQREIKRQRRLVKNREYAQTSRIKKKQYVEELKQENEVLKEQVRKLQQENDQLRTQLASSDRATGPFVASSPSPPWSPVVSSEESSSQQDSWSSPSNYSSSGEDNLFDSDILASGTSITFDDMPYADSKSNMPFSASFATSFCLFVFMFSFGLFTLPGLFSTPVVENSQSLPSSQPLPLPDYGYHTGRSLLGALDINCEAGTCRSTENNSILSNDWVPTSGLLTIDDVLAEESLLTKPVVIFTQNNTLGRCEAVF